VKIIKFLIIYLSFERHENTNCSSIDLGVVERQDISLVGLILLVLFGGVILLRGL
jgi:hypothetical protein